MNTQGHGATVDRVGDSAKPATYQDVLDAPENVVAELIDGVLYTQARPRKRHARFASRLGVFLGAELEDGLGRAGGWIFLDEPELHLGQDIVVPDIGGWRVERYPFEDPDEVGITVPPDWICEVLSPSTMRKDRALKLPLYARAGVQWAWLADPGERTLEVYRRAEPLWQLVATHAEETAAVCAPFEGLELPFERLW